MGWKALKITIFHQKLFHQIVLCSVATSINVEENYTLFNQVQKRLIVCISSHSSLTPTTSHWSKIKKLQISILNWSLISHHDFVPLLTIYKPHYDCSYCWFHLQLHIITFSFTSSILEINSGSNCLVIYKWLIQKNFNIISKCIFVVVMSLLHLSILLFLNCCPAKS